MIKCETKFQTWNLSNVLTLNLLKNLPNDGTNYLLIFGDSSEELCKPKEFDKLATTGRHKKLNCIYIKHYLFHKTPTDRDAEIQNTHLVLFKSPRDVNQISVLASQLGLGKELVKWYLEATAESYGHLMIDLCRRTSDSIRYSTECTSFPSKFFLPSSKARITDINDKSTELLYSEAYSRIQPVSPKNCSKELLRFFCECAVNLVKGNFENIKKKDIKKFRGVLNHFKKDLQKKNFFGIT